MKYKMAIIVPLVIVLFVLDHTSKWWIDTTLGIGERRVVVENFFDIVHVRNTGAAFGILSDADENWRVPFFYISSILALLFLLYYLVHTPRTHTGTLVSLGLILGGAIGNITDRLLRGSVVDFLSVHWGNKIWTPTFFDRSFYIPLTWPAFNVADSAITVGIIVLVASSLRVRAQDSTSCGDNP